MMRRRVTASRNPHSAKTNVIEVGATCCAGRTAFLNGSWPIVIWQEAACCYEQFNRCTEQRSETGGGTIASGAINLRLF